MYKYILILLLATFFFSNVKVYADENSNQKLAHYLSAQIYRINNFSKNDELMEVLNVRPNMTILDIGTGTGQYAYKFAEKLQGTGNVFATDIDADFINYVIQETKKRGLTNLYPVLVKMDGVDEFYAKHNYDLILVFNVYWTLRDRVNYFSEMKKHINKNGRVVILSIKFLLPFSLHDINDFDGLIKELTLESEDSPFYKDLHESTRELLRHQSDVEHRENLKNAIVADFNQMRLDTNFWRQFLMNNLTFKEEVSFPSGEERSYATWLLLRLDNNFDLSNRSISKILRLNKLLIVQRFQKYLYKGTGIYPYKKNNYYNTFMIKREFQEAGYRFEKEYNFIPFQFVLVFSSDIDVQEE